MTIKEIAILAKTSRGTVDRVVNGRGKVKKEVEERVLKVIKETNYVKNEVGKSLSKTRDFKIGVVIGSGGNSFFSLIDQGINREINRLKSYGFRTITKKVDIYDSKSVLKALDQLAKEPGLAGLIISALNDDDVIAKVNTFKCPVVALNLDLACNKLSYVGVDYFNSGALLANFANLVLKQNANIAIVMGSLEHSGQKQRLNGLKNVLREDINIVDIKQNYDDLVKARSIVSELIEKYKDGIDCFIFLGAGTTGGLRAIREANVLYNYGYKAITVDQTYEIERALKDGMVLGTITQHPYTQGVKVVDVFYDLYVRESKIDPLKIIDNSILLRESFIPHQLNNKKYSD